MSIVKHDGSHVATRPDRPKAPATASLRGPWWHRAQGEPGEPGAATPTGAPIRVRRRRWWFWPIAVLVQVLLLLLLLLVWVLGTESGLRTAFAVSDDLAPGVVQVGQVQGRLARDVRLTGLAVRLPDLELSAAEVNLRWRPWGALAGTLRIESLTARELSIATAPTPPDPKPLTLPALVLPLGIEIDEALVEGLYIRELRDDPPPPFVVERIGLAAGLQGGRLELRELTVTLLDLKLEAHAKGQGELAGDWPLGLELTWTMAFGPEGPEIPPARINGGGRIGGDLSRLRIEYRITGAVALDLTADITGVLSAPAWDGRVDLHAVDLPAFGSGLPTVDLHGTLITAGDRDQASVKGRLDGQATGAAATSMPGALGADLDLSWADQTLTIRTLKLDENISGARLSASGEMVLAQNTGALRCPGDLGGPALALDRRGGRGVQDGQARRLRDLRRLPLQPDRGGLRAGHPRVDPEPGRQRYPEGHPYRVPAAGHHERAAGRRRRCRLGPGPALGAQDQGQGHRPRAPGA